MILIFWYPIKLMILIFQYPVGVSYLLSLLWIINNLYKHNENCRFPLKFPKFTVIIFSKTLHLVLWWLLRGKNSCQGITSSDLQIDGKARWVWKPCNPSSVSEIPEKNWLVRLAKTGSWGSATDHTSIHKVKSDWERYQISISGPYILICLCLSTHMHMNLHIHMHIYIYKYTYTYICKKFWGCMNFL